jgi:hypothetical protein
MEGEVKPLPTQGRENGSDWKIGGILMFAAAIAALAVVPYLVEILRATGKEIVVWEFAISTLAEQMILMSIAVCVGLKLGPRVELGTPLLSDWLSEKTGWARRGRSPLVAALIGGFGVAIAILIADPWLEALMPPWPESAHQANEVAANMAAWKPLLASFSAGVTEEILCRFCLMTLFVWLGVKMTRRQRPSVFVLWTANVLAALLFGLAHLSNVVQLGIPITPGMVLFVVLTNGIGGVVFGWLFWRHGLIAAILAHVVADVVLKVAVPIAITNLA